MQKLQQTAPISDMRKDQESVLSMMEQGPVVLMARSRPKAVIVDPDEWNAIAQRLQMLETINEARRLEAIANEQASWVPWEKTKARMTADATVDN
ncbi:MAG: type II toxin-antitoxin system Phd/YefM family antitoxin [Caldilineaceae bacterium]|nr:type II toxin-antitoxin system Phd/YefM family antitoxin [Caldilineaceae bacterium]